MDERTESLLNRFNDLEFDEKRELEEVLDKDPDPRAVQILCGNFQGYTDRSKEFALDLLALLHDQGAIDPLTAALSSNSSYICEKITAALFTLGVGEPIEKYCARLLDAADYNKRQQMARVLGLRKDPAAVDALCQAMKKEDYWYVRASYANALARIGDRRAIEALKDAFTLSLKCRDAGEVGWGGNVDITEALTSLGVDTEALEREIILKCEQEAVHGSSQFAGEQSCQHCGKKHAAPWWPSNGDNVPFYFETERKGYSIRLICPHCGKDWYIAWDKEPGSYY